jgi:hypothetical protein
MRSQIVEADPAAALQGGQTKAVTNGLFPYRFRIAADKVLHPTDLAAPIFHALPDSETIVSWPKSGLVPCPGRP